MPEKSCLFCKIATGAIPADVVFDSDDVMAFRDVNPQAPSHVLVIPKRHVASLEATTDSDVALLGTVLRACREVARSEGISETGYRTVANTGEEGGQTVHHLHVHVLGGRPMTWPPG